MSTAWWPPVLEEPSEQDVGRRLTVDEWLALDEDQPGELVDGMLSEEEMPDAVHELAVAWLIRMIGGWLGARGFVFGSELKHLTTPRRGRKPDIAVFLPGTRPPAARGPVTSPPDIIVEVVTPTPRDERRDRVEKMAEYAAFGVRFYWLVDPALATFELFGLTSAGTYAKLIGVTGGIVTEVPGCAGLTIDVGALWTELKRLPAG